MAPRTQSSRLRLCAVGIRASFSGDDSVQFTTNPSISPSIVTWDDSTARRELSFALGHEDAKMRVVLPRLKWEAIADPVRAEFNRRLRQYGLKTGTVEGPARRRSHASSARSWSCLPGPSRTPTRA